MKVKKVNIDKLIDILFQLRKEIEYIDMEIHPNNVLKIFPSVEIEEQGEPDINQSVV